LKQDDFTCRFCGFRSQQYQRVVPFRKEFVTTCGFCEQVLSLERAGMMGSGVLIWLPEISQTELNHVARAIYIARAEEEGEIAKAADRALDALLARRTEAKKRLGSEDPLLISTVLRENLNDKERAVAAGKLDGIRMLPLDKHLVRGRGGDFNGFPQMVKFWRSKEGPFADLPPEEWLKLFAKVAA
jgi:intracellular multiplication protein IcmJ